MLKTLEIISEESNKIEVGGGRGKYFAHETAVQFYRPVWSLAK